MQWGHHLPQNIFYTFQKWSHLVSTITPGERAQLSLCRRGNLYAPWPPWRGLPSLLRRQQSSHTNSEWTTYSCEKAPFKQCWYHHYKPRPCAWKVPLFLSRKAEARAIFEKLPWNGDAFGFLWYKTLNFWKKSRGSQWVPCCVTVTGRLNWGFVFQLILIWKCKENTSFKLTAHELMSFCHQPLFFPSSLGQGPYGLSFPPWGTLENTFLKNMALDNTLKKKKHGSLVSSTCILSQSRQVCLFRKYFLKKLRMRLVLTSWE